MVDKTSLSVLRPQGEEKRYKELIIEYWSNVLQDVGQDALLVTPSAP